MTSKKSPYKISAVLVLALIVLVPLGIYIFSGEPTLVVQESSNESIKSSINEVDSYHYINQELGIELDVPKDWGEVQLKNEFISTQIIKEITFSNEPRVKLISMTQKIEGESQQTDYPTQTNVHEFCNRRSSPQEQLEREHAAEDLFRLNGDYYFGDCEEKIPYLNKAQKTSPEGSAWIPLDEQRGQSAAIELYRQYFWDLSNSIYPALTFHVKLPTLYSDGFCVNQATKSLGCMNEFERILAEAAFNRFEAEDFFGETEFFIHSLVVNPATEAEPIYESYFKSTSTFQNPEWGIALSYPTIFAEPVINVEEGTLRFHQDQHHIFHMERSQLQALIQAEVSYNECEADCIKPKISSQMWEAERTFIEESDPDQVECVIRGSDCAIVQVGEIKMLVRYSPKLPFTSGYQKEYTFYIDDQRFDIVLSPSVAVTELEAFKALEETDFTFGLLNEIVQSITVIPRSEKESEPQ